MGLAINDNDFSEEIQDMRSVQVDTLKIDDKIFSIQTGKGSEWLCLKRQVKKLSHHKCCFGINH